MTLYAVRDVATRLYLCDGSWGEEPEWFSAAELQTLNLDRPTVTEAEDFSPREWTE